MEETLIKVGVGSLSSSEISQWKGLFATCFSASEKVADAAFGKYQLNSDAARFCFAIVNGDIVAAYCGFIVTMGDHTLFLSTDTMSNGVFKNATVRLAKVLYPSLAVEGVEAVCGYPNKNVENIRVKKLGWRIEGNLYPYLGVPLLWRLFRKHGNCLCPLWSIERPKQGFMLSQRPLLRILGRHGLYHASFPAFVFTLSAFKPGVFFLKVPELLIAPKRFGYVILDDSRSISTTLANVVRCLDLNTIDVP